MPEKLVWQEAWPQQSEEQKQQYQQIEELRWLLTKADLPSGLDQFLSNKLDQIKDKITSTPSSLLSLVAIYSKVFNNLSEIASWIDSRLIFGRFWKLISTLDETSQNSMIEVISKENPERITGEFKENGVPTDSLWLELFSNQFWVELAFNPAQSLEKKESNNVRTANMANLAEVYNAISDRTDSSHAFTLLKQVAEWDKKAYEELKQLLLSNPEQLKHLVSTVQAFDNEHQTHHYETLRRTLISVDPVFLGILGELAVASSEKASKLSLNQAYISSLTGDNPKLNGSLLESTNQHGDKISIDVSTQPPKRILALEGSDYALETEIWIGVLHKPEIQYSQKREELNTQLKVINALQTEWVQGHIEDLSEHWFSLAEIQNQFKQVYKIDISFINSLDELKNPSSLNSKQVDIENQLKQVEADYREAMMKAIKEHKQAVAESDEVKRQYLEFITNIGFDQLPKEKTDQLIWEVSSGLIIVSQINLNPANLDLKNGCFWESQSEKGWTKWKENLIKFYNLMITWNPDTPIIVESHIWTMWKKEDPLEIKHHLISNELISESWTFNIETARGNMSKKKEV